MKFTFYCEIYKVRIYVYFGAVDDKMHKFMRPFRVHGYTSQEFEELCSHCAGSTSRFGRNLAIWMPELPTKPKHYGTIAHEIAHVVSHIFDLCDIQQTNDNDEPFAYLTSWITQRIYEKILTVKA